MNQSVITVKVAKKNIAAKDIVTLELVSTDEQPLPRFTAGSHIDVYVKDNLVRQYSLCNDPEESHRYVLGVLREPNSRGGSEAMHESVKVGDLLKISAPKNHFELAHSAKESVLFAGGIGITPILCMAERLANIGADFSMHYCARSEERMAFLNRIKQSSFANKVSFHFDDGSDQQKLDIATALGDINPDKHLYVCGPKGFLDFVRNAAKEAGWSSENVHYEYFSAEPLEEADTDSFKIKIASTGAVYTVKPDETIVDVLADNGIDVMVSCQQGICGTCVTKVLDGIPDHHDHILSDEEKAANDQMTVCCSRAKSETLILDL